MSDQNLHKIGLATAIIIGMNAMIGSGVFTAPSALATEVGPAGILAYIFVVAAIWFMGSSLARLAELFPGEGSFYLYAKQWGGHKVGMLAIFSYILGAIVAMGLLLRITGEYLVKFFPAYSSLYLSGVVLAVLILANVFGVAFSRFGQHLLIFLTVSPLIIITLMCLTEAKFANIIPFAPYGYWNVLKATRIVIFGFFGFECAASLYKVVKDPHKNVPRAFSWSILGVGALYTLFVSSIIFATPPDFIANAYEPITDILLKLFPQHIWLINVLHISILSAIIGSIHSMIWSVSHLIMSIIDKVRSPRIHLLKKRGVISQPLLVVIVGLLMGLACASLQNIDLFFSIIALFVVFTYILSMITLLTLPSEWKSGNNIKTIIGMLTALTIFYFAADSLVEEVIKFI